MTVNSQENELKQQEQQRQQQQQSKMNINNSNNNKIIKTKTATCPSLCAGPKRPTGRPPEGPDSDPIRIRAERELIKKIQIVTLNDDLGFYRPANWVNPTEKPTPP